jgi:hypothetical protein
MEGKVIKINHEIKGAYSVLFPIDPKINFKMKIIPKLSL